MKKALHIYLAAIAAGVTVIGLYLFVIQKKSLSDSNQAALFESLAPELSGISFTNTVTTSDSLSLVNFEYIYIGGGVGIGDFNNDGLKDIFFVGNKVPSQLYLNKGNLKFQDITKESGIKVSGWPFGVSVADVNADGLPDIFLSSGGHGNKATHRNELFINLGSDESGIPHFKEMGEEYGFSATAVTIQSVFFDYDNDGDLDMYELNGGSYDRSPNVPYPIRKDGSAKNTDRLYRNDFSEKLGHAVFTDVSRQANILEEGYGLGISILDINEDGWPDIYVTNDYLSNDLLYINNHNGSFSEEGAKYFNHTSHFAMGNDVGDINNDGLMDLVAVDMLPEKRRDRMQMLGPNGYDNFYYAQTQGYLNQYMRNTLQLNMGMGKFSEIAQLAGMYKTSWSWAPLFADFDNDGYQDLFITNGFGKDVTDLDFVRFRTDISAYTNTNDKKAQSDKEIAKALDERPGIKTHPYLYRNRQDNTFEDMSVQWNFTEKVYSNGAAYADLDNDGDLDIVTNNMNAPAHIYRNKLNDKNEKATNNYLRVDLTGPKKNTFATGTTVKIYSGKDIQIRYLSSVRGFESTVETTSHFGLGKHSLVDSLEITWPDGKRTIKRNIPANAVLKISYRDSDLLEPHNEVPVNNALFTSVSPTSLGIDYKDKHQNFIDFNFERLIPRKYSENGQGIAVADVNNDGLEDFFIGGGFQQTGRIYLQNIDGRFTGRPISKTNDGCLDAGSLFFDADDDGDLDLYVVSGGNQFTDTHKNYQDRLYKNDGRGNFTIDATALPLMISSGSCIAANDFDGDGDLDLFVGGGVKPGFYPQCSKSYLLRNEKGKFTDITEKIATGLQNIGIVTSALWTDIDNDYQPDLLLTGEWMPISVFKNNGKNFTNITKSSGLDKASGLWQSLTSGDFDNDGDVDYIAGNWGLNCPYTCTDEKPMTVSYQDFDKNGNVDPIMSYYEDGQNFPVGSLDYMTEQMPVLKKQFLHYADYAKASTEEILRSLKAASPTTLTCKVLASSYIENKGNGRFELKELPQIAQFAPLFGTVATDVNDDGNLDLVGVGNFYWTDVVIGKYDAAKGLVLTGDGKGNFHPLSLAQSGFVVDKDARAIARIESKNNQSLYLISCVLDSIKVSRAGAGNNFKRIYPAKTEVTAVLNLRDGKKRKMELSQGGGYLSQSSRSIVIGTSVTSLVLSDAAGRVTRSFDF